MSLPSTMPQPDQPDEHEKADPAEAAPSEGRRPGGTDGGPGCRGGGRRRYPLWAKLSLAVGTLALIVLSLEALARVFVDWQPPRQLRDGIYVNGLPLSTGFIDSSHRQLPSRSAAPLPRQKPEGQIRIFIFGESSVYGTPWGPSGSAPTILYDELTAALPDRDFVVVNMGRSGSVIPNTYYHLLSIRPFEPDIIIFYLGINDMLAFPGEECFAARHSAAHGFWRRLVERFEVLWVARAYAPALLAVAWSGGAGERVCPVSPFSYWTDLTVQLAKEIAPHVLVTTPVRSSAYALEVWEPDPAGGDPFGHLTDTYRDLLVCQLEPACDYVARFEERVASGEDPVLSDRLEEHNEVLDGLGVAWRQAAEESGAEFIDFRSALERASPGSILLGEYFADEVHLTVDGYGFLARNWLHAIADSVDLELSDPARPPAPEEVARYHRVIAADPMNMMRDYLRAGFLATTVPGLKYVADTCWTPDCSARDEAQVALEWLRWRAGLLPDASSRLEAELEAYEQRIRGR